MELWKKEYVRVIKEIIKYRKKVFLLLTPEHGNLGDHAIAMACRQFIGNVLPEHHIIEIQTDILYQHTKEFCAILDRQFLVLNGGGFLGSLWLHENNIMMEIIESCGRSRIVVMPQTTFFYSKKEKEYLGWKKLVRTHKQLHIFLRDEKSFKTMMGMYPQGNFYLCPDIVTSLDFQRQMKRDGIMLCFREYLDKEMLNETKRAVDFFIQKKCIYGMPIKKGTTFSAKRGRIDYLRGPIKVKQKLAEFSRCKLVLTDRLHAMIFSAITATPCVALNNISGKVKGGYKWFQDLEYIHYANDLEDMLTIIEHMELNKNFQYPGMDDVLFWELKKVIMDYAEGK